jgi:alkanesulfonate monooxygenase SsuD/methylene tetrahydromethanopterin reductase-like flavin-dependent oxidoreductase (luciferase family)
MEFYFHSCYLEPEHMLPAAQAAEAAGWAGFAVSDHIVQPEDLGADYPYAHDVFPRTSPWSDTWTVMAHLAAGTSKLKFTNAAYILGLRHPLQSARQIATAAALSDYRVYPAVAAGWMKAEFDVFGIDFKTRFSRLDECIDVMRRVWEGGYVAQDGRHFRFDGVALNPVPKQRIPLWGAGDYPNALARAARMDGYLGALYDVPRGQAQMDALQAARQAAGTADRADYPITCGYISDHSARPTLDECKAFAEMGYTGLYVAPFETGFPPGNVDPGLDAIRRSIDEFAETVIGRL